MAKYLVIGSNSFSGQDFIDLLLDDPAREVIGVSRSPEKPDFLLRYKDRSDLARFRFQQVDLNHDMQALLALLDRERPDYIVNFAAQSEVGPSWDHPDHWFETNTVSLARFVNHLRGARYLKRYLHVSSPEVYGNCVGTVYEDAPLNPSTPYAASKAAADLLLGVYQRQFHLPIITVRATNVYGPRQQLFKIIMRTIISIKNAKRIPLHGGGYAVKSYIHIRDVSRGELAMLEKGDIGALYHLSPDQGVAVRDVVERICRHFKIPFDQAVDVVADRPGQDAAYVIDSSKARKAFGWAPAIGLEEGLGECIAWVERHWTSIQASSHDYIHKA
jgi:dTDP-glucose 4,6-dehydratase